MKTLCGLLVMLVAAGSVAAQAAEIPQLESAWYRVEVLIFERTGAADANAVEVLGLDASRSFPRGATAFVEDERTRALAYPLDAATRAEPALPTVTPTPGAAQRKSTPVPVPATPAVPVTPTPAQRAAEIVATYETGLRADSFRWQPASTLLLKPEAGRLQRDAAYRVVLHAAWIQPVPDRERPLPILIQTGERIGNTWRIEGTIDVTLGRYLHVDTRLWYRPDATATATGAEYEQMREQRRMRSGELHYFDHPRFGMLMRIDPVTMPDNVLAQLTAVLGVPVKEPVAPPRDEPEAPLRGPARIP